MRLATTSFADGLALDAYNESRSLMQQPRQAYTEFEDIIQGYNVSPDGVEYGKRLILINPNTTIQDGTSLKRTVTFWINWLVPVILISLLLVWMMQIPKGSDQRDQICRGAD